MLKNLIPILAAILAFNLDAQNSEPRIKPSDPTLLYSQLNTGAGINVSSAATWQINIGGTWAIKEKFSFGFEAPITNNPNGPSLFEKVSLNAAYQLHYNTGLYNSSLLSVGLTTPFTDDYFYRFIREPYSQSYEFRIAYTGGLKISDKLSFYPKLEYYRRFGENRVSFLNQDGQIESEPILKHQGLRAGLTMSYDFNAKNFIQLGASYGRGAWQQGASSEIVDYISGNTMDRYEMKFRYQYAFHPQSQIFMDINYQIMNINAKYFPSRERQHTSGLFIGYSYFLD